MCSDFEFKNWLKEYSQENNFQRGKHTKNTSFYAFVKYKKCTNMLHWFIPDVSLLFNKLRLKQFIQCQFTVLVYRSISLHIRGCILVDKIR